MHVAHCRVAVRQQKNMNLLDSNENFTKHCIEVFILVASLIFYL